ncbi:MOSC domain-containing protein [Deinococcus radiopugnans]|uniref:MOSC domain-containing protein n=1 Tax=Deinococcus radiopugnans TaxID=57497 RepID=UPI00361DED2B
MTAPDCQVHSVNVGQPSAVQIGPRPHVSGIDKRPQPGRVLVSVNGLAGDHVVDTRNHGGPDQAVYLYTREDYAHWEALLGARCRPVALARTCWSVAWNPPTCAWGTCWTSGVGGVRLEVTAPRIPCATLAAHVGDRDFVRQFVAVARPGFYTRVLRGGEVGPGDAVRLIPGSANAPSIGDLFALWYDAAPDPARLEQYLNFPLAVRVRARVQRRLAEARGALSP